MSYITCKQCGCQMSDKSEACPVCGTLVGEESVQKGNFAVEPNNNTQEATTSIQTTKTRNRNLLIGVVLVAIIAIATTIIIVHHNNQEKQTAEQLRIKHKTTAEQIEKKGGNHVNDVNEKHESEEDIIREIKKQVVEAYKTGPIEKRFTPEFKKLLQALDVSIARGECPKDSYMETYFTIPLGDEAKMVDVKTQNNGRAIVEVLLGEDWGDGVGAEWSQTFVVVKTGSKWLIDDVLIGDYSFKDEINAFFNNSDGRR